MREIERIGIDIYEVNPFEDEEASGIEIFSKEELIDDESDI